MLTNGVRPQQARKGTTKEHRVKFAEYTDRKSQRKRKARTDKKNKPKIEDTTRKHLTSRHKSTGEKGGTGAEAKVETGRLLC